MKKLSLFLPMLLLLPMATAQIPNTAIATAPSLAEDGLGAWLFFADEGGTRAELRDTQGCLLASIAIGEPTQELVHRWLSGGIQVEARTKVPAATNGQELAISRHAKLVRAMLLEFPKDP